MKMNVDEKDLNYIGCDKKFECLEKVETVCCKVTNSTGYEISIINDGCDFNICFGLKNYCACHIRKEIFNKYGV